MAERRMFAKTIIDSDAFLDMPMSAQCLYFHLAMRADDEGFLNNPKKVQRMVGASEDDLKILLAKRFILAFETGVIVIKHWKIHNYIQSDRFKPTIYAEEKAQLSVKPNGAYTECIQDGYTLDTQVRLVESKDSIGKESSKAKRKRFTPPTLEEVQAYVTERGSSVDANEFFEYYQTGHWIDSEGKPVQNWKQKLLTWEKHEHQKKKPYAAECKKDPEVDMDKLTAFLNSM